MAERAPETPSPAVQQSVPGNASGRGPTPFPIPSNPDAAPWATIPVPQHVSTGTWQESYYDPTSPADASIFCKLPSGPCDIRTGKFTDDGFHAGHKFRQT